MATIELTPEQVTLVDYLLTLRISDLDKRKTELHSGVDILLVDSAIIACNETLSALYPTQTIEG
jgi:hypothetical protein